MTEMRRIADAIKENKTIITVAAAVILMTAAAVFLFLNGKSQTIPIDEEAAESGEKAREETPAKEVYVDVGGCVKRPGVYRVDASGRVFEAIEKAGGTTAKADTSGINQAVTVTDGQKIYVPARGEAAETPVSAGTPAEGGGAGLININTADRSKLEEIPGIGPVTAEKIIRYREENGGFKSKEDLKNVSGIGDKTYEKMDPVVTI